MGIPFIVPGSQTLIPNSLMNLRERFPQPNSKRRETLSPAAQCTVPYHLFVGPWQEFAQGYAQKVHYSPMMMSKVKDELKTNRDMQNCSRAVAPMVLDLEATSLFGWEQVKPQLTSPVKKTRWVQWARPPQSSELPAGMSALSLRTVVAADRLPTYALPLAAFQDLLERSALRRFPAIQRRNGEN